MFVIVWWCDCSYCDFLNDLVGTLVFCFPMVSLLLTAIGGVCLCLFSFANLVLVITLDCLRWVVLVVCLCLCGVGF